MRLKYLTEVLVLSVRDAGSQAGAGSPHLHLHGEPWPMTKPGCPVLAC